ncbi:hypothetical protein B296_00015575 [Ensete ventricosum]|uniref:Uncharacterized protein n=1 Tax=Ensete ventricosum TaxID=4639 RepID=A0A426XBI0_ENSVE|nr:hypothetical protein B296_00015575 [Ensete ventricosum]
MTSWVPLSPTPSRHASQCDDCPCPPAAALVADAFAPAGGSPSRWGRPLRVGHSLLAPFSRSPLQRHAASGCARRWLLPLWASPGSIQPPPCRGPWPEPFAPLQGELGHNRSHPCRWPSDGRPPLQMA